MLILIMSLILDYTSTPIDYYFTEENKVGISKPVNRKQRRGK